MYTFPGSDPAEERSWSGQLRARQRGECAGDSWQIPPQWELGSLCGSSASLRQSLHTIFLSAHLMQIYIFIFIKTKRWVNMSVTKHIYVAPQGPALHSPEAQLMASAGCENSFPNSSASNLTSNRPPSFKPLSCRPGSSSPAASHVHGTLMSPHTGEPGPIKYQIIANWRYFCKKKIWKNDKELHLY